MLILRIGDCACLNTILVREGNEQALPETQGTHAAKWHAIASAHFPPVQEFPTGVGRDGPWQVMWHKHPQTLQKPGA